MSGVVETEAGRPRPLSGGLWTLFSWLRRDDQSSSSDSLSSAGSDRTVASFAFLSPAHCGLPAPLVLPPPGPPTDSYRRRVHDRNLRRQHDRDLTLHRKYGLYRDVTVGYDVTSLPPARRSGLGNIDKQERERRATSESLQRRTPYVPGKRRAPPPPARASSVGASVTLPHRHLRKRRAPQPPIKFKEKAKENNALQTENIDMNPTPVTDKNISNTDLGCKSEKYVKKELQVNTATGTKIKQERSFLKQIFDNKKRRSAIETSSIKILPSISELDKQAAEIIETYRSKERERNNNDLKMDQNEDSQNSDMPKRARWICITCLRRFDVSVNRCSFCLSSQRPNISTTKETNKNESIYTQTEKNSIIVPTQKVVENDERQQLKKMLKEMKDSLPKKHKLPHNEDKGCSSSFTKKDEVSVTETPTLRIGSKQNEIIRDIESSSAKVQEHLNQNHVSKRDNTNEIVRRILLDDNVKLEEKHIKNKIIGKDSPGPATILKSDSNVADHDNKRTFLNKNTTNRTENADLSGNRQLHTPLKISSLLNPVYIPKQRAEIAKLPSNTPKKEDKIVKDIKIKTDIKQDKDSSQTHVSLNVGPSSSKMQNVLSKVENKNNSEFQKIVSLSANVGDSSKLVVSPSTHVGESSKLIISPSTHVGDASKVIVSPSTHVGESSKLIVSPSTHVRESSKLIVSPSTHIGESSKFIVSPSTHGGESSKLIVSPSTHIGESSKLIVSPSTHGGESSKFIVSPSTHVGSTFNSKLIKKTVSTESQTSSVNPKSVASKVDEINQHSRRRELINQLEKSIAKGDEHAAADAAAKLAQLRLSCSVLSFTSQILGQQSNEDGATVKNENQTEINKTEPQAKAGTSVTKSIVLPTSSKGLENVADKKQEIKRNLQTTEVRAEKSEPGCSKPIEQVNTFKTDASTSQQESQVNASNLISISVWIEDKEAARGPIKLQIGRDARLGALRRQAEASLGIAARLQRWIVGRTLCADDDTPLRAVAGPDLNAPFYLCLVEFDTRQKSMSPNKDRSINAARRSNDNLDKILLKSNKEKTGDVYTELMQLERQALVPNTETFKCEVCMEECIAGNGVVLRDCVHSFCRDCLADMIRHCEEPAVSCPAMGCPGTLHEREIRALVSPEEYEKWLARGLAAAESGTRNAFHCRTRDCKGWALCEAGVRKFPCPVCKRNNCVPCQAIHEGETCEQYRSKLQQAAIKGSNQTDEGTKALLESLISRGEALECPECSAIITKKWGCDWVKCSACKTEICWVTRGRRWGPAGRGDTSAGCRCGVDGKRCHPSCGYCH